ncbi:MAG: glutathione S-transferase [Alphaproteobacteria bacterium]|mgnify:FL=1|jgi:glutathione S-transferase|nr:glutathione S-transferase [Rhodobiaceae bacterium]MBO6542776.1 glutathione S-transferase [Alphaproteobacteria bacterium]MDF1626211.1 glutathione S-transferase [Parvibaculaceae bacterium]
MIKVHHLNNSRSQRILWMLEELGVPYEIVHYQRDKETNLAPESLKQVHPLGKSPVLEDGDVKIAESGAIVEYLAETYGKGAWMPKAGTAEALRNKEWLHYSEGSVMLPLLLSLYTRRLGEAAAPLQPRIISEMILHFSYMNAALEGQDWFSGDKIQACDIQMSFPVEAGGGSGLLKDFPNLAAFLTRIEARPAYKRALEKGGPYQLGG